MDVCTMVSQTVHFPPLRRGGVPETWDTLIRKGVAHSDSGVWLSSVLRRQSVIYYAVLPPTLSLKRNGSCRIAVVEGGKADLIRSSHRT